MRGTTACLRGIAARCALAIASAGALACGSGPSRPAAAVPSAVLDRGAASPAIARELDDFHDAAARADEARYFAHFSDDAVFLGTDATERWNLAAFRAFAHPHFAAGKAWSFHATRRAITGCLDCPGHPAPKTRLRSIGATARSTMPLKPSQSD